MKRFAVAIVSAVLVLSTARAEDPAWISADDAAKKKSACEPVVVVFAKEDAELLKSLRTALAVKRVAKAAEGFGFTRVDPGDELESKKLGVEPEKGEKLIALDGYGIVAAKHERNLTADTLSKLLKQASDATTKKKKIQRTLDAAVKKGEAALKAGDTRTASEQFLAVLEHEETVPCPAVRTASEKVAELTRKGQSLLSEGRTALGKGDYSTCQKKISEARESYPTPEVVKEAKSLADDLATAINNAQRGR